MCENTRLQVVQHLVSHLHLWIFPCKPSSSSLLVRHNLYLEAKRGVLRCTHLQEGLPTSWLIGDITVYGSRARYTGTPVKQPSNDSADPVAGGVSSRRQPPLAARCSPQGFPRQRSHSPASARRKLVETPLPNHVLGVWSNARIWAPRSR